jgi:hypothetical protein
MKRSIHTISTIMAHPHTLPSSPARAEGCFFRNTIGSRPVVQEGGAIQYQLSRNEHDLVGSHTGILDKDHCSHITVASGRRQCLRI